jgi:hypothetical protein
MVLTDALLLEVENAVLETLREARYPYAPKDLIERLKDRGYPDDIIRTAIWYLVDRMQVSLTPEFHFALGTGDYAAIGA